MSIDQALRHTSFVVEAGLPQWPWLLKISLHLPGVWRLFGKQRFVVARKSG